MLKITIDFDENSAFESKLEATPNFKELKDALNSILIYKDQLVQIKVMPWSMTFSFFQDGIYNFDAKIQSKSRIIDILTKQIRIYYKNNLLLWLINELVHDDYNLLNVSIADFILIDLKYND